jgi:hypothetical protein
LTGRLAQEGEKTVSATLRMTRKGFGIELRRGRFEILVDGSSVGSLSYGDTVQAQVEPGHHTVRISAGRYSSRARSFDAADGGEVSFRCHGANLWPIWAASFVKTDLAISLVPE